MSKIKDPEKEAIKLAIKHEKICGNNIKLVSHKKRSDKGKYKGFDLLSITPKGKEIKIEVKGCTRENGIPDPFKTEFNKHTGEMIADFMYVFYFPRDINWRLINESKYDSKAVFYKIPRKAIKRKDLLIKWGYVIKPDFKKRMSKEFKEKLVA